MAAMKSSRVTLFLLLRAAINAASLQTLAISAPENPGVCFAKNVRSILSSSLMLRRCTLNIASRSFTSGRPTSIWRSKRPARINALSKISTRLVAANTITPALVWKPSISVRSWLSVFSRSSLPENPAFLPRARPMASISSIKTIQGAFSFACSNKSLTREAPTPTNISTKSEPEIDKNGTLASPATALANRVLPVPGGPTSNAPLGIFAPNSRYLSALRKKSTISIISTLASSKPATSLNVTRFFVWSSLSKTCARALPTFIMFPAPPAPPRVILRIKKNHTPTRKSHGSRLMAMSLQLLLSFSYFMLMGLFSPNSESSMACLTSRSSMSTEPMVKYNCSPCSGMPLNRLFSSARYFVIASSVR